MNALRVLQKEYSKDIFPLLGHLNDKYFSPFCVEQMSYMSYNTRAQKTWVMAYANGLLAHPEFKMRSAARSLLRVEGSIQVAFGQN